MLCKCSVSLHKSYCPIHTYRNTIIENFLIALGAGSSLFFCLLFYSQRALLQPLFNIWDYMSFCMVSLINFDHLIYLFNLLAYFLIDAVFQGFTLPIGQNVPKKTFPIFSPYGKGVLLSCCYLVYF